VKSRIRPRLGDVIELAIAGKGLAYVQYVNNHREPPVFGPLVRVLPGVYKQRPASLADLTAGPESYFVFIPIGVAAQRGYVRIVGHEAIPAHARDWPLFKAYNENIETGKKTWFLWDGKKSRLVGDLPKDFCDCSMKEVASLKALEDRIATGWMPRDEVAPGPPRGLRS
jgi:hypothetical protein